MRQWIKYAAVVCVFILMTGFFLPDGGNEVNAADTGTAAVSENESDTTSWTVTVNYDVNGGVWSSEESTTKTYTSSSAGITHSVEIPAGPERTGYQFSGWLCSVSNTEDPSQIEGNTYEADSSIEITLSAYSTITFTAQWEDTYQDTVTVNYVPGEGATWTDANGTAIATEASVKQEALDETIFNINIPEDVPVKEGYEFTGWLCSVSNAVGTASISGTVYDEGAGISGLEWTVYGTGSDTSVAEITFTAQWTENTASDTGETISDGGTYTLYPGIKYQLGGGTWTVDNGSDSCEYTGGSSFYITEEREYIFTKK